MIKGGSITEILRKAGIHGMQISWFTYSKEVSDITKLGRS
jgi:hypothetical protein